MTKKNLWPSKYLPIDTTSLAQKSWIFNAEVKFRGKIFDHSLYSELFTSLQKPISDPFICFTFGAPKNHSKLFVFEDSSYNKFDEILFHRPARYNEKAKNPTRRRLRHSLFVLNIRNELFQK